MESKAAFRLTGEQCTLFGDITALKSLYNKIFDKIIILLIDWSTILINNWSIPIELKEYFKLKKHSTNGGGARYKQS